ncbi:DUF2651 family protein [Clostridium sp. D2Q-11]|uniref:DUF2651 family protein n=1 Tax=Anaeromonas frigoriresistens TaxID=2683708 RepID=A0A942UW64_9FIRM|nr:DUF2651 family protein [Anaeromonas frigoriresistens]MBS4538645.1 DUF2651 family protein [Anaeromonas frigoriresistens]
MEFILVLMIFPAIIIFLSMIATLITKKFFILPIITFITFLVLTYTIFNDTFLIWVIIYTALSLIVSVSTLFIMNKENKNKGK